MVEIEYVYGSANGYLKASEVVQPTKYKIQSYYIMNFKDGSKKVVLILEGQVKRLALSKENAYKIASKYGTETKGWVGKEIIIEPVTITYNGKTIQMLSVV